MAKAFVLLLLTLYLMGPTSVSEAFNGWFVPIVPTYVRIHNRLRTLLALGLVPNQPRAINMRPLKFDARLAREAQELANSCEFHHTIVKDPRWSYIGQNIFRSSSPDCQDGITWRNVIETWFNEHDHYFYPQTTINKDNGHYTQVAWADTTFLGCGFAICRRPNKCRKIFVCNYAPGGNIWGQTPYKTIYDLMKLRRFY